MQRTWHCLSYRIGRVALSFGDYVLQAGKLRPTSPNPHLGEKMRVSLYDQAKVWDRVSHPRFHFPFRQGGFSFPFVSAPCRPPLMKDLFPLWAVRIAADKPFPSHISNFSHL